MHDPLGGMLTHRGKLVSSTSSIKVHMIYGYISSHLRSQGRWGIGSGASTLFSDQTRSRMNIIWSRISSLRRDEAEEDQGVETLTATALEGDNGDGEGGAIKIRSVLQTLKSSLT